MNAKIGSDIVSDICSQILFFYIYKYLQESSVSSVTVARVYIILWPRQVVGGCAGKEA